jgi:CcmD family protein
MKLLKSMVVVTVLLAGSAARHPSYDASVHAQQPPPQQQDEFVPIDQLPPQDQLPAAPMLVGAYSFVAIALFAYLVSLARRLTAVQHELERLEGDVKRGGA